MEADLSPYYRSVLITKLAYASSGVRLWTIFLPVHLPTVQISKLEKIACVQILSRYIKIKFLSVPLRLTEQQIAYSTAECWAVGAERHRMTSTASLASCLTNAQPLPAHRPAVDDNSLIGSTSHDLTDDWSLASTHFVDSQYEFRCLFGCVFLSNQIYFTTVPLQFIWSICPGN